jgi:hypothetical protein
MKTFYQTLCISVLLCTGVFASGQTPILNSYPSSNAVVLLDFDGHIVEGTSWNGDGAIVCDGSNLNAAQMIGIFNRIAEDYRPFTVNITTDPAVYLAAPATKRMRVVLTTSSSWYGSAGGVAYINSFTWGDNTPCFVFTALLNYNTKNIAEATAHEIGHTLGLRHQSSYDATCNKTTEYNAGTGSGEIGWAPIMGVGYYRNMTLWNYGANPFGCTSYQDDLSIITGNDNGISYRTDDHANTITTATPITVNNNTFTVDGIIERPADVDAVKFTAIATGRFTLDAIPYSIASGNTGANIDLEVELLNSDQTVIGVYNPTGTLNASIDTQLTAGTYYLRVQGKGNIYAPNYASLGSYMLTASLTPGAVLPVHKLQLKGITQNKQHKLDWEIIADEKVVSQILEVGTNGVTFQPVANVTATTRGYNYTPSVSNLLYYRLHVTFDNGRQYYSNIIALRNNGSKGKPYMIGNVITGNIIISSPAAFSYSIHDLSGRTIGKGNLAQGVNTISTGFTAGGLYIIQYYNGAEFYTEKFRKE